MPKVLYDNIEFDSENEVGFYCWLLDAKANGFISDFKYHVEEFKLFDAVTYSYTKETKLKSKIKIEQKEKTLLQKHSYQPDFLITATTAFKTLNLGIPVFLLESPFHVDVKGGFSQRADQVTFPMDQKWVYSKYQIYVLKVIPEKWYMKTWVPLRCKYTPVKKDIVKKYSNVPLINEFINNK